MGFFGDIIGQELGGALGGLLGREDLGRKIGGFGGSYLPFKKGGKLKKAVKSKPKASGKKAKAKKSKK